MPQPDSVLTLKAGGAAFKASFVGVPGDFKGWAGASNLTKVSKLGGILGAVGSIATVVDNGYGYFQDGVDGPREVVDFVVDTTVDLSFAAGAGAAGAAVGTMVLGPLGTVLGAGVGLGVGYITNKKFGFLGDKSFVDVTKDGVKKGIDWVQSLFW